MTEAFYRLYWWLQRRIAPGLRYCLEEYEDALAGSVKRETRWLDLGCGHNLLPQWRAEQEQALTRRPAQLVGLDYDMPSLRNHHSISQLVRGDILRLPFRDGSFNLVSSSMVFEHLKQPRAQLEEIRRVMNPGGELIFLTPNTKGYTTILGRLMPEFLKSRAIRFFHDREEHDVFPTFYRINSPAQIAQARSRERPRGPGDPADPVGRAIREDPAPRAARAALDPPHHDQAPRGAAHQPDRALRQAGRGSGAAARSNLETASPAGPEARATPTDSRRERIGARSLLG